MFFMNYVTLFYKRTQQFLGKVLQYHFRFYINNQRLTKANQCGNT
jgi:hypothetical protein